MRPYRTTVIDCLLSASKLRNTKMSLVTAVALSLVSTPAKFVT